MIRPAVKWGVIGLFALGIISAAIGQLAFDYMTIGIYYWWSTVGLPRPGADLAFWQDTLILGTAAGIVANLLIGISLLALNRSRRADQRQLVRDYA